MIRRRARKALTLVEVVLALVILVVIAAGVWPLVSQAFSGQTLQQAADQVRSAWARARVEAMTSGTTQVFRFHPDQGLWWATAHRPELAGMSAMMPGQTSRQTQPSSMAMTPLRSPGTDPSMMDRPEMEIGPTIDASGNYVDQGQLPVGVVFRVARTEQDARAMAEEASEQSFQSPGIYFYADGTTSTASLAISDESGLFILLALRGLTGTVSVSDPLTPDELPALFGGAGP